MNKVIPIVAVLVLVIVGVIMFVLALIGPDIFRFVQASVSTSVPTAPENQNSGILSTPTVKVIPTETLVPKATALPTETPVPSSTPTVDPSKAWPEFYTGTPKVRTRPPFEITPFPKDLYGIKGQYFREVRMIKEYEGGFKIFGVYPGYDMYIKVTGSDVDWLYMEVNAVKLKVRPGTFLFISSMAEDGNYPPLEVAGVALVMFDPLEQRFGWVDISAKEFTSPLSSYFVVLRTKGVIEIGYAGLPGSYPREVLCNMLFEDLEEGLVSDWKWSDSSIVHDARVEGCPYVGVIE